MMITFSGTVETLAAGGASAETVTLPSCAEAGEDRRAPAAIPVRRAILVFISVPSRWLGPHNERTLTISPAQAGDGASGGPVCRIQAKSRERGRAPRKLR